MEEIAITKFKTTCLAVIERVRRTRKPVLITRFGKPLAEVVPHSMPAKSRKWIGTLAHTGRIQGDIISPANDERKGDALRS